MKKRTRDLLYLGLPILLGAALVAFLLRGEGQEAAAPVGGTSEESELSRRAGARDVLDLPQDAAPESAPRPADARRDGAEPSGDLVSPREDDGSERALDLGEAVESPGEASPAETETGEGGAIGTGAPLAEEELVRHAAAHLAGVFGREEHAAGGESARPGTPEEIVLEFLDAASAGGLVTLRFLVSVFGHEAVLSVAVDPATGAVDLDRSLAPPTTQRARLSPDAAWRIAAEQGLGTDLTLELALDPKTRRLAWQVRRNEEPSESSVGRTGGLVLDLETGGTIAREEYARATSDRTAFERQTVYPVDRREDEHK
ncbi:MAG: hypothetical protein HY720_00750 [Planctomycetes bacterium]|nr:hypothetical protein [Planctomycetota bacterium]